MTESEAPEHEECVQPEILNSILELNPAIALQIETGQLMRSEAEALIRDTVDCCLSVLENEADRLYDLKNADADLLAEKCHDLREAIKQHFGFTVDF